ncbi:predicted protein [Chaetomium globosum CBS 148.51]|uniref:Uncharacterized protein n=1 Tax=Chaetomium globosum (strain ATCC 6205 / CBS 148.51 / DSM 1962 / NBRC 6347 / NRRL 1970) TaxID=306901 RepID=Q2HEG1_CHAGB|nr:uncharacterized protein CHGG_01393 [Chaetomium globosum CBS 148.51]EAQ93158.1 predicted protein [Chaetomium globosum CBS 148.51]
MRLQAITLSLLAATGLATPIRRDVSQAVYTLRLTSPVKSLDGLYLTTTPQSDTDDTSTLGVSTSTTTSPATQPVRFYPVHNPDTDLDELRRSSDTVGGGGALAVVGANGLLDFAALADPEAVQAPDGTTVDWTSFRLGAEKKEGGGGAVEYVGKGGVAEGRWVAFPVGGEGERWSVKWRDVSAWTTENYMPVEVVYELVKEE